MPSISLAEASSEKGSEEVINGRATYILALIGLAIYQSPLHQRDPVRFPIFAVPIATTTMPAIHYAIPEEAQVFAQRLLVGAGLPIDEAGLMAKCLVLADIRGVVWDTLEHYLRP